MSMEIFLSPLQTGTPIVSGNEGFTVVPESGAVSSAAISAWSGGSFQSAPSPPPVGGGGANGFGLLRLLGVN